jgi:hypothetical protein
VVLLRDIGIFIILPISVAETRASAAPGDKPNSPKDTVIMLKKIRTKIIGSAINSGRINPKQPMAKIVPCYPDECYIR